VTTDPGYQDDHPYDTDLDDKQARDDSDEARPGYYDPPAPDRYPDGYDEWLAR
jgi:hypothetical protein